MIYDVSVDKNKDWVNILCKNAKIYYNKNEKTWLYIKNMVELYK